MPDRITRELLPTGLRLTYRWFGWRFAFLALFCVFWDGFLVNWYLQLDRAAGANQELPLMFTLFPLIHVAVGVGLTYYTLCGFVNRTTVDVSRQEIRVRVGPLPWFGSRRVAPMQIAQVYREEIVRQGKNGAHTSYQLSAALKDGKKLKLLSGLDTADLAPFLEQEIERHLGIRDQAVVGEMRK